MHDAPSFKHWEGVTAAREKLAETFGEMIEGEREEREGASSVHPAFGTLSLLMRLPPGNVFVPAGRLVTLLEQAVSYQISRARYKPKDPPAISSCVALSNHFNERSFNTRSDFCKTTRPPSCQTRWRTCSRATLPTSSVRALLGPAGDISSPAPGELSFGYQMSFRSSQS